MSKFALSGFAMGCALLAASSWAMAAGTIESRPVHFAKGASSAALKGSAQCDYGVVRGKPGNAEVHVTPPGGFKRVLTFAVGKVTADSGASVKATKSGDLWSVDVNDYEHYRIPDAVVSGG